MSHNMTDDALPSAVDSGPALHPFPSFLPACLPACLLAIACAWAWEGCESTVWPKLGSS